MFVLCPACRLEGELPDDLPGGVLVCPRCESRFAPQQAESLLSVVAEVVEPIAVGWPEPPNTSIAPSESKVAMPVWLGTEPSAALTPPPIRSLSPGVVAPESGRPRSQNEPPVAITPENAGAHVVWIENEVDRFNQFVAQQLDLIQKTKLDLTRADAQLTAAIVTREQELNREKAALTARAAELDRRESDLTEQRAKLERRVVEVERLERSVQRKLEEVEEIDEALRAEFEDREREVERQRRAVEEAADELRSRTPEMPLNPSSAPELIEALRSVLRNLEPVPARNDCLIERQERL